MKNVALVTGASGGIGRELARIHAAKGGDLVVVARSEDELQALAEELQAKHGTEVKVLARDLALQGAAVELHAAVEREGIVVDVLINNAGFGGHGLFYERDWKADESMIQLNIATLTGLTRMFVPAMVERGSGKVLNLASMAGFLPGPLQAVYYATKAYVLSFTQAIAEELRGTGVTATALCPGPVDTGFAEAADAEGVKAFDMAADAATVARKGYEAMLGGDVIHVPGLANKVAVQLPRFLPRKLVTMVSKKTMEKG